MKIYRQNKVPVARRIRFLATIVAMTLGSSATAANSDSQSHPMRFDRLSLDDGLSQSTVISILQDSRGLMWFGTENGLNSYNGYEFEQFLRERGNPQALSNDFIYDVEEDRRKPLDRHERRRPCKDGWENAKIRVIPA